jgi:hypothetical protein
MDRYCIACSHFRDGAMHRAYVTPRCTVRGDDAAMFMREFVCGLEGRLWQPNEQAAPSADMVAAGRKPEPAI